jgi:hypothetical protein
VQQATTTAANIRVLLLAVPKFFDVLVVVWLVGADFADADLCVLVSMPHLRLTGGETDNDTSATATHSVTYNYICSTRSIFESRVFLNSVLLCCYSFL